MIFLIVYSRIRHALRSGASFVGLLAKIKTTRLGGLNFWQGHLCNSRADFLYELLKFGKEIKTFLQIL
jgi:hypothetical protein